MIKVYCPIEDAIASTELVLHPDLDWSGSDPIARVVADAYDAGLDEADHPLDDELGGYSELTLTLTNRTIRAAADKIKAIHAKDLASKDQTIAALTERVRVLEGNNRRLSSLLQIDAAKLRFLLNKYAIGVVDAVLIEGQIDEIKAALAEKGGEDA